MKKGKWFLKIIAVAVIGMLLLGLVIMMLWNWLIPQLFNGPQITFWQALGLFVLAKILFGGWKPGYRDRRCGPGGWKKGYYEKLSSMTPEERERFKQRMSQKWCSPAARADDRTQPFEK